MYGFFFGSLNHVFLSSLGASPVDWLGSFPMPAVIVANIWRGPAFTMIIFLGALKTIPPDIYEAARIDAPTPWRVFGSQTSPGSCRTRPSRRRPAPLPPLGTFVSIRPLRTA